MLTQIQSIAIEIEEFYDRKNKWTQKFADNFKQILIATISFEVSQDISVQNQVIEIGMIAKDLYRNIYEVKTRS